MSWTPGGPNPWGQPGRPGRPRPQPPWGSRPPWQDLRPNLTRLFARFGGGGRGAGRGVLLLLGVLIFLWLLSGFYRVQPDQIGVVTRFGAFVRTAAPGLNYHLPWPIESVERPAVTRINRVEIGYRSRGRDETTGEPSPPRNVPAESLMLTGDENIIDVNFTVFWRISDAPAFLFSIRNPESTIKSVAESVMREVIGRSPIQPALTAARAEIEQSVRAGTQAVLDKYKAGVEITQVQLLKVDPPAAVIDSFRDVQRANTDAERMRNEAEAYRNDIVPRARGDAARIVAEAQGEKEAAIAIATGRAQRFTSVLAAYEATKEVTMQRLYLETMEQLLQHAPTLIVDEKLKGVLPLLPIPPLELKPPAEAKPPASAASPAAPAAKASP